MLKKRALFRKLGNRFKKKACEIPKSQAGPSRQKQEVIPIGVADSTVFCPEHSVRDPLQVPMAHTDGRLFLAYNCL